MADRVHSRQLSARAYAKASPQVQPHNRHLGLGRMLLPDVCHAMRQIPCAGPVPYDICAASSIAPESSRAMRGSPTTACIGVRQRLPAPSAGQQRTRRFTTRPSLGGQNRSLDASSALVSITPQMHAPAFLAAGPCLKDNDTSMDAQAGV